MLGESQRIRPVPGRQQGVRRFSSGFCFRLVFVSKQSCIRTCSPADIFHRHWHTDTHLHTHPTLHKAVHPQDLILMCKRSVLCYLFRAVTCCNEASFLTPAPTLTNMIGKRVFPVERILMTVHLTVVPTLSQCVREGGGSLKGPLILQFSRIFSNCRK